MTKQRREHEGKNRRRLRQALLWSLVVHVLVLGIGLNVPQWRESLTAGAAAELPLVARLVAPGVAAPAVPSVPSVPQPVRPVPVRNLPPLLAGAAPAPVAVPPAPTFAPPPVPSDGASSRAASSVPAQAPAGLAPASTADGGGGLDADALGSYKLRLAAQARRFKRYPAQAQAANWVGTAEVRLAIARGGQLHAAELGKSSGHELLDRAALAMIDAAAQRTELPSALQGQAFAITLPVEFRLEDR